MPKPSKSEPTVKSTNQFPVVGVGASAGGLEAFKKLLKAIPDHSGMAYVLVQHLDPNHESLLPELLQRVTNIPVLEISDDIKVEPDHIYIIPSNKMLVSNDGVLQLSPRPEALKNTRHLPIDLFFTSLAEVHQSHAIGVVLSGNFSDGTLGLKAIKDQGGVTFAQDEKTAAHVSMPHSAIAAGVVDFVLPPEEIPKKLSEIKHQVGLSDQDLQNIPAKDEDVFKQILSLLRIRKGIDFTYYKQTTIRRRILRRMAFNKNDEPADYLKYVRENKTEQDALYQDLLIPVTEFFRDHKVFDNLCESVFPNILKNKAARDPIRIWVAGCSTGEEAYSIAMCLKEFLGDRSTDSAPLDLILAKNGPEQKVQIFATDISEPAIAKARRGVYAKNEVEGISPQRMQEFFVKTDGHYQVNKQVRDMCVFAVHNFLKDPPFGKIDLVSCRNVLIYMEPYLQKKALTTFHYALNPGGFLLLGKSETSGSTPDLFASAGKNDKLYTRKDVPGRFMHVASQQTEQGFRDLNVDIKTENKHNDFQKTADDIMLSKYTPAGVVVNDAMDIVYFRGNTGKYLEQAPGKPTHNLMKMAREGLAFELRNILHKTKKENASALKENIEFKLHDHQSTITIEAIPLPNIVEPHFLILFHDAGLSPVSRQSSAKKETSGNAKKDEKDIRIEQLEKELAQSREDMRGITEDQEAANEELQSANEELLSGSEELQSLNEELETSKEELQSSNEELVIVNQELVESNTRINDARKYSDLIIATIHESLVVLNKDLIVRNANNSFYKTFHLTSEQTEGKPFYELGNRKWDIAALREALQNMIAGQTSISSFEITHVFPRLKERTLLFNVSLMQKEADKEQLILLAIEDITERKQAERKLELMNQALQDKIEDRTKELEQTNRSLDGSNQQLQQSNVDLQQFAHVASHDLKEPLRKIKIFSTRLETDRESILSENGKIYLGKVQSASDRMLKMIDGVLAYSIINSFEQPIETIDLQETIKQIEIDLEIPIQQKQAIIEVGQLPKIEGASVLIYQLFLNLINNSLKFAKQEETQNVSISSKLIHKKGVDFAEIMLVDTGIGFSETEKDKIFNPFTILNPKDKYEGTGLGLSLCKKIVLRHGGTITASGAKDKGAIFHIILPVKQTVSHI